MEEADVIRWAREAGGCDIAMNGWTSWVGTGTTEFLTRFAALVRAQALEDAAKVCEANENRMVAYNPAQVVYDPDGTMARKCAAR